MKGKRNQVIRRFAACHTNQRKYNYSGRLAGDDKVSDTLFLSNMKSERRMTECVAGKFNRCARNEVLAIAN